MPVVRNALPADFEAVLTLNEADLPQLSALTRVGLERLATVASYFSVAEVDGRNAGFLLAVPSEADHHSANFLWFKARYPRFLYVDRVVVAAHARRAGIASRLYEDLELHARASRASLVACEINVRPPNPSSLAFHDRRGFVEVGTKENESGTKTLSMRVKQLEG